MNEQKSIYACYEEIKQREIRELKERLKAFGGVAHFGPDYTGEGATGNSAPYVCVHSDEGPYDVRVNAISIDDNDCLTIVAYDREAGEEIEVELDDISYGHIEFITDAIPLRTFSQESFSISKLSREDLQNIGFDTTDVDDKTMQRLAKKLGEDYCEQLFWEHLGSIAEIMGIQKAAKDE